MERLNERNVFEFARTRLDRPSAELDLSALQPDRVAATVLTAALLTYAARTALTLVLPATEKRDALARNGLFFALANRSGPTSYFGGEKDAVERWLAEWRRPWTRGTRAPLLRLGHEEHSDIEPSVFGRDYGAFVNPHRASGPAGSTSGVAEAVRPWLHRLLPRLTADRSRNGPDFVHGIGAAIDELVENVAEHAAGRNSLELFSLVLVSIARGNEADARYRLYISVIDTGPGIIETASRKVAAYTNKPSDPTALLRDLFRGRVEQLGRARGFGLPSVWETVRKWDGARLIVASNGVLLRGERGSLDTVRVADVGGTIISAVFPLPPKLREP
jgi:hypothetical protein